MKKSKLVNLAGEFDAQIWAKEFVRIFTKTRLLRAGIDEQTMVGWFANAIMAGYDRRSWEKKDRPIMNGDKLATLHSYPKGKIYDPVTNSFIDDPYD